MSKNILSIQFGNGLAGLAAAIASGDPGGVDVVYYSPRGHRVRTKAEMSKLLGDQYDLTPFDFQVWYSFYVRREAPSTFKEANS